MGDTEGEGMERRCEPTEVDAGVGSSEPELFEPDDDDETETDLARPRAVKGMVMGAEGRVFLSLDAIFCEIWMEQVGVGRKGRDQRSARLYMLWSDESFLPILVTLWCIESEST